MFVIKRSGRREAVSFDKILSRIANLCDNLDKRYIEPVLVAQKVILGLYDGVTTTELDNLAAETATAMSTIHPDYGVLAGRIAISNLHKNTKGTFSKNIRNLHSYVDPRSGDLAPLISDAVFEFVMAHQEKLDAAIDYKRDFLIDYFGYKTLERSYLLKMDGEIRERPQHLFMRVAVGIHQGDVDAALETYHLMSQKWFIHATPTLFNAGTPRPQMSSCFLVAMQDDSIEGIYDTLSQCAKISQSAGGIGLSAHNIRAKGSYIKGTNGESNGLVPMLQVFNYTARYVDQGGNKRKGAFAIYLEPWHADIFDFLDLKKNHGKEEMRARDLFYALWIPDLFMKRVKENGEWSLFCPNECKGLYDCYGDVFEHLYEKYEREGKAIKTVKAQELWFAILDSQTETGTPYMLYKDAANRKSNQKNLGTIRSSNLCTEIIEYSSKDETAVCNLASINLSKFVDIKDGTPTFNHDKLFEITQIVIRNLNKVIDVNYYPVKEAKTSNMRHRPVGLGVQGLADAFILMRFPFDGEAARQLNKDIFETMYYAALTASNELAQKEGTYETYDGSPASQGILQFDMWKVTPSNRWDWAALKADIKTHGLRNSLLIAPMPTASTSQILGNNECFEPYTSNIYTRRTLSGEFIIINRHLLKDLIHRGLWDDDMKNALIANNGSIQSFEGVPQDLKDLYKTAWEIKQKVLLDMSADRGAFICQSQSLNVFMLDVNYKKLSSLHFYAWQKGLKTGMYYLRTRPAAEPIKFTVDMTKLQQSQPKKIAQKQQTITVMNASPSDIAKINEANACSLDDPGCDSCGA